MTDLPTAVSRILIIGPSNIGDAILAGEVIAAVHRRYPAAHLTVVVGARARALFLDDPRIHTLVNLDAFPALRGRLTVARSLWRYRPQLVVDLRHTLYPLLLCPGRFWRYLCQPPRTVTHMRERHLWKLRAQAPDVAQGPRPSAQEGDGLLAFCAKDAAHVEALCHRWRLEASARLVLISPGARTHIKRWTPEGFARVADRLITEEGATVVFSGEPEEESVVEAIRGLMRERAHSAVGLTTIRQLGLLMQRAQLVVTNDSASLHLASALRRPTVAIFGPTDAAKYGPTAPQRRTIRRQLFCAPCERSLCRFNHECMRFISPDEVFHAAQELLTHARS